MILFSNQEIIIPQYGVKFLSRTRLSYVRSNSRINTSWNFSLHFLMILRCSSCNTFLRVAGRETASQFKFRVSIIRAYINILSDNQCDMPFYYFYLLVSSSKGHPVSVYYILLHTSHICVPYMNCCTYTGTCHSPDK